MCWKPNLNISMERKLFNTISGDTEEEKNADDILRVFEEDSIAVAENEKQNKFKIKQFFNDLAEEMKPEISKRIRNFELDESKSSENEKEINMYLKFETAISESLAFISQSYYGRMKEPTFKSYRDKTDPMFFKKVYNDIKDASTNKSIEEFDKFSAELYIALVKDFHEDINAEQLASIFHNTREKVNSFKNN